jgi:sugar phosphate isomerase/epimerase
MGKESNAPVYNIIAYVTLSKDRVLSGSPLAICAKNLEEQKEISVDIAKAMKADTVQLHCGDYMVIRT